MNDFSTAPTERLLAHFEAGVTIDELERRYHSDALQGEQLASALELFLRAERMTGHDFQIRDEHRAALVAARERTRASLS